MGVKQNTVATWKQGLEFEMNQMGTSFEVDGDPEMGGSENVLRPKALMLSALAGCTGMDVASLMKKMRADKGIQEFTVTVEGELTEDHPRKYQDVSVVYRFVGSDLQKDKLEKAIGLSIERYCGVFEMFRSFANLTTKIEYSEG